MRVLYTTLIAVAAAAVLGTPAKADFVSMATLTPGADGATNSHGTGMATIDYMASTDSFTYTLTWANLTGAATMAHIHDGALGVGGPVVLPIFMSSMPASDTISGTLTQAGITPVNGISTIAEVAQLIESGDAYVNIHTAAYPGGELRGQLAVSSSSTPEPATTGLMGLSLVSGALLAWRGRRTRSRA